MHFDSSVSTPSFSETGSLSSRPTLAQSLSGWITGLISALYSLSENAEVTQASNRGFGHYQCAVALRLAKQLRKSPLIIAQAVVDELKKHYQAELEQVEAVSPGFINLRLAPAYLTSQASQFDPRDAFKNYSHERILIDFSSPNVAKEMHVGHLRSTIIGDSLARIYEFLGAHVWRVNHVGDWGTQFGMLIAEILEEQELGSITETIQRHWTVQDLMHMYKKSKGRFDTDEQFAQRARSCVVKLQAHDPEIYAIWQQICAISRESYEEIYRLLDVTIVECGESFYNSRIPIMIQDVAHFLTISDGARCLFVDGLDTPLILQKSDGGFNYDSTDFAALRYRVQELGASHIVIVTDAGQRLHFDLIFHGGRAVGFVPEKVKLTHVPFGLVLGQDGKKFKTRSGETEKLRDLIDAAIEKARQLLRERDPQASPEQEEQALVLGINAIKYADLSTYRLNDYQFSYEKMLKFEGNTATFLMYAYVRAKALLRRFQQLTPDLDAPLVITHESEQQLLLTLLQFDEALEATLLDFAPNRLADYLWILAQDFHAFFRDCRLEGSPHLASRVALTALFARWFGVGLQLLGLRLLEQM